MDKILISAIDCVAAIGVTTEERTIKQRLSIDIEVWTDAARAARDEDKTNGRRSGCDCGFSILPARDSADLDHHDRSSRSAADGSADFIRCSPTRNA